MNAITMLRGPRPVCIAGQSVPDLWLRLGQCDGSVARLEDRLNEQASMSVAYIAVSQELDAWQRERDLIEAELTARFLSWAGGVDLRAFVGRLGQ